MSRSKLGFAGFVLSWIALASACLGSPATMESIEAAYRAEDEKYLVKVSEGKIQVDDDKTRIVAEQRYYQILQARIAENIENAKKNGDVIFLEKAAIGTGFTGITEGLKKRALSYATSIRQAELATAIELANKAEDLASLDAISSDTANRYLSSELKKRAIGYAQAIKARMQKREAEARVKESAQKLKAAFEAGDSEYLRSLSASLAAVKSSTPAELELGKSIVAYLRVLEDPETSRQKARAAPLNTRVRNIPPSIANWVSSNPESYIDPLMNALLSGVYDPFEKVKLIHDWIADNIRYNFDGLLSGNLGDNSWGGVLRSGVSVCAGYANLFDHMCNLGGIESKVISGFSKGYGFDPFSVATRDSNHAWNAVKILGYWYLVDVTWDSGYINYFGQNVKDYSTEYLFAAPEEFLYSHFPESASDQLLDKPLSWESFCSLPDFDRAFFDYGLALIDEVTGAVLRIDKTFMLEISCPKNVALAASVFDFKGKIIDQATLVQRNGEHATVLVNFPSLGNFQVVLFAKKPGIRPDRYESVISIAIAYSGADVPMPAFPLLYGSYSELGCKLISPLAGVLVKGNHWVGILRYLIRGIGLLCG